MDLQPEMLMDCDINTQPDGMWHFADSSSGFHTEAVPSIAARSGSSQDHGSLWTSPSGTRYMRPSHYLDQEIPLESKRSFWKFWTPRRLVFQYDSLTESDALSGDYTWCYKRKTKQYTLKKQGDSHHQVFAILDIPNSKVQFYCDFIVLILDGHFKASMNNEEIKKACEDYECLVSCMELSVVAILEDQQRKMENKRRGNKTEEKQNGADAQTKAGMDCGCKCHCFPGICILTQLEKKCKNTFTVTVKEV